MTTMSNRRTLGEEFANIVPFNENDFDMLGKVMSVPRKLTFMLFMCVFKYILNKLIKKKFNYLRDKCLYEIKSHTGLVWSIIRCLPDFDGML
jgi:hypothetical protein